jgi:hypothetical protein
VLVLAACAVLGAIVVWCGWSLGPARHLGAPKLDALGALGYGLLLASLRLVTTSVMAARSTPAAPTAGS